jgi:Mitochondrial ribosomal death-associated protein 3
LSKTGTLGIPLPAEQVAELQKAKQVEEERKLYPELSEATLDPTIQHDLALLEIPRKLSWWVEQLSHPDAPESWEERLFLQPDLYLTEDKNTPATHTEADIGQYYEVDEEMHARIPEHIRKVMENEYEVVSGRYMMVRESGFSLVNYLKFFSGQIDLPPFTEVHPTLQKRVFLLTGMRQCGKTAALYYAAQHALQSKWLLLTTDMWSVIQDTPGLIVPSRRYEGLYDQPLLCRRMLDQWAEAMPEELSSIKLKLDSTTDFLKHPRVQLRLSDEAGTTEAADLAEIDPESEIATAAKPTNLFEFITFTRDELYPDADAFYQVLDELAIADETKLLLMIDGYNSRTHRSPFVNPRNLNRTLDAGDLGVVHALEQFQTTAPKNGFTVLAESSLFTPKYTHELKQELWTIEADRYSLKELTTALSHYKLSQIIAAPDIDKSFIARCIAASGGKPDEVLKFARLL